MVVFGYKGFNTNQTNRYGKYFEKLKTYSVTGEISFGNNGNGYHLCKNLCDVFRYFNGENDILVAEVIGFGEYCKYDDEYYGYYDMFSFENIIILNFLTRNEIIEKMLTASVFDVEKFLITFKLLPHEINLFQDTFSKNNYISNFIYNYQINRDSFINRQIVKKTLDKK